MADITMCQDKECPKREQCYRFTAKVNEFRQSYFADKVRDGETCDYFVNNN